MPEPAKAKEEFASLQPIEGASRPARSRLRLRHELVLVLMPTLMMLCVLVLLESLSRQRLLFASLASSAFLIYLDPGHGTNSIRTIAISHLMAAALGVGTDAMFSNAYTAAGSAMVFTIFSMVLVDVVHPPAVSTAFSFAFRTGNTQSLILFAFALLVIIMLVILQRLSLWTLNRLTTRPPKSAGS